MGRDAGAAGRARGGSAVTKGARIEIQGWATDFGEIVRGASWRLGLGLGGIDTNNGTGIFTEWLLRSEERRGYIWARGTRLRKPGAVEVPELIGVLCSPLVELLRSRSIGFLHVQNFNLFTFWAERGVDTAVSPSTRASRDGAAMLS